MPKYHLTWIPLSLGLLLAGCNTGSGVCGYDYYGDPYPCPVNYGSGSTNSTNSTPVTSTLTFPVQAAFKNLISNFYSFNLSATDGTNNYALQYTSTPQSIPMTFNGQSSTIERLESQQIAMNGTTTSAINTTFVFQSINPIVSLGSSGTTPGTYETYTGWQDIPASGQVGQSFSYANGNIYQDSSQKTLDATDALSISLQPDTANTALMCFDSNVTLSSPVNTDHISSGQHSTCFVIDGQGNILAARITQLINGQPLTFQ